MIPREVVMMMARRRLVAEVRTDTAIQALSVVDALAAGGITTIEISLGIPGAPEILSHLATRQDVLIGAGSVLDAHQAADALSSGARFIASPICNTEIVSPCREANVTCILGGLTPTEVIMGQRAGAEMVKLFPVEVVGGPAYVRAMMRQLTHASLQISGEISPMILGEYLELPVRTIALGSLLIPPLLVERGNWQALTNRARMFVDYAANPHMYAARFLQLMGVDAPMPARQYAPTEPEIAAAAAAAVAAATAGPLNNTSMPLPHAASAPGSMGGMGDSASGFKPWDSRPIQSGDEEDWLR